jgi:hypothetical protein
MNSLMAPIWAKVGPIQSSALPVELQDILQNGWLIGPAGSLLLRGLYGTGWKVDWHPDEVASHEYEVNDVSIPAKELPEAREEFLPGLVGRARAFAYQAMRNAESIEDSRLLVAVISIGIDEDYLLHGATVKFCTRRGGPLHNFDDLERYRLEAIALVESGDAAEDVIS